MGFGRGTKGNQVASFLVERKREKNANWCTRLWNRKYNNCS
jgi:hypothetical protein